MRQTSFPSQHIQKTTVVFKAMQFYLQSRIILRTRMVTLMFPESDSAVRNVDAAPPTATHIPAELSDLAWHGTYTAMPY